ncbi:LysM peptidoglycan-binding domain-containing protein [Quadrisphaera oryzae]|uniref:LysM peptidoglycan-binding domain-containing protein n=1 Tax=Quadrisphaera TaxID=317661 RepID=UPI001647CD74|nr:LysM domain-containing protein [Quadrisphaera sp. RL12-1S]MBC3761585.1 LysM peptidoglycan-binding domain-containing protein [Quadrisphaera sp. RL12-1S]
MDARAWRIAGGAAVALLVLVALVAWRADALSGGWLLALRLTGLMAVVGLLAAVVLASLAALRPPVPPQVVVRVPVAGAPSTSTTPGRAALVPLTGLVLLAVLSAAPALVVLVLARGDDAAGAAGATAGGTEPTAAVTPSDPPSSSSSSSSASSSPSSPSASASGPASEPAPSASSTGVPPASPAQLPSEQASGVVCELVVAPGDSLWSLAEAQLGEGASAAAVDARWRALYAQNTAAVGADPDLVRPGLVLRSCS